MRDSSARLRLPDFCSGPAAVAVILIVVLTAVVLSLARQTELLVRLHDAFGRAFGLWIGLGCTAVLCAMRTRLEALPIPEAAMLAVGAIVLVVSAVSAAALWLGRSEFIGFQGMRVFLRQHLADAPIFSEHEQTFRCDQCLRSVHDASGGLIIRTG